MRPRAASAPAKNGGGSSLSFVSRAVPEARRLLDPPCVARAGEVDDRRDGGQVRIVQEHRAAAANVRVLCATSRGSDTGTRGRRRRGRDRGDAPPTAARTSSEGPMRNLTLRVVDAQFPATAADTVLFAGIGCDGLVDRACGGEDDGAGARAGLERRPSPFHVPLEPLERGPGEAPVLAGPCRPGGAARRASVTGVDGTRAFCARCPWPATGSDA